MREIFFLSIWLQVSLSFIGQFVHHVGGEGMEGGIVILARCVFLFIREHEVLVLDLSIILYILTNARFSF